MSLMPLALSLVRAMVAMRQARAADPKSASVLPMFAQLKVDRIEARVALELVPTDSAQTSSIIIASRTVLMRLVKTTCWPRHSSHEGMAEETGWKVVATQGFRA